MLCITYFFSAFLQYCMEVTLSLFIILTQEKNQPPRSDMTDYWTTINVGSITKDLSI